MRIKKQVWVVLILVVVVAIGGVLLYCFLKPKPEKEQFKLNVLDTISEYDYKIDNRDSELFKKEFEELKVILTASSIDYKAYSEKVARMFIIDLYSIDSALNKYDVGATIFYHSGKKTMFETKVKDKLYDLVEDDSYGDRKQKLPLVKEMNTLSIEEGTYDLDGTKVDAYIVTLSWKYEEDLGYDNEGTVIVVDDGIKKAVVHYTPALEE